MPARLSDLREGVPVRTSVLLGALLVGCSIASSDPEVGTNDALVKGHDELAELDSILGNERVGRGLHASPSSIPYRLTDVETMFGIGRACSRPDSKEIFVVEEKSTRITGAQVETNASLPRLVVGGCNKNPSAPGSDRATFELFLAIVSDTNQSTDDPLSVSPVEAMALDDTTGLYNFYVLEPPAQPGQTGTVTRFVRRADDVVEKWQKVHGKPATKEVSADRKCFNCHVHGDPIMNELAEPWSNWVSFHKTFSRPLTGTSRALVSEGRPFSSEHTRSSLAGALEKVIKAATAAWIQGPFGSTGVGLGPQILAGKQPGGVTSLLKSVFCETAVNYEAAFSTVPMALHLDKTLADFAQILPPLATRDTDGWTLLPVRSETDKRVELFLQKAKVLQPDTVRAIRVIDDTQDIFSKARCGLLSRVDTHLEQGAPVDAPVAAAIAEFLTADAASKTPVTNGAQRAYIRALLDPSTPADVREAVEAAYIADVTKRVAADVAKLEAADGRRALEARWRSRQAAAIAMFPDSKNPLPITHPETPASGAP